MFWLRVAGSSAFSKMALALVVELLWVARLASLKLSATMVSPPTGLTYLVSKI